MRFLFVIAFFFMSNVTFSQKTFKVDNFSKDYFGKVFISDTSEVFSQGWIGIYDRNTKNQLIKVKSDELAIELHNGQLLANIKELPYGEQSLIIYEDFNFDGVKDFAIEDGQNSCYHGPSFKIYLADKSGFRLDSDFTRLAQEYCGMFDINRSDSTISTMAKDGCCWHQFSEFKVVNNKLQAIVITEDDKTDFPYETISKETWNGTKMIKTSQKTIYLDDERVKIILSFKVNNKGKEVVLFNINDRTLNYALLVKDEYVEFSFPREKIYKNPDFEYDSQKSTLTFRNGKATYIVHDKDTDFGIEILVNGKRYFWEGDKSTSHGSLDKLKINQLDNVTII